MNQKLKMCDIETLKKGDEVLVRAIVEDVKIHSCHTKVSVRQCTDYAGCIWKAKGINSVDVFVLTDCEGCREQRREKLYWMSKAAICYKEKEALQNQLTKRVKVVGVEEIKNILKESYYPKKGYGQALRCEVDSYWWIAKATAIFKAVYGEGSKNDM
jgi:hypothetical protein